MSNREELSRLSSEELKELYNEELKKTLEKIKTDAAAARMFVSSVVSKIDKTLNNLETLHVNRPYVDLGLPSGTMWAEYNVGSESICDPGDYIRYDTWRDGTNIAKDSWGGEWRVPALREFQELVNFCTCEWTTENGNGIKVTSKQNGNSIFFPAGGFINQFSKEIESYKLEGCYWCDCKESFRFDNRARCLFEKQYDSKTKTACNIRLVYNP